VANTRLHLPAHTDSALSGAFGSIYNDAAIPYCVSKATFRKRADAETKNRSHPINRLVWRRTIVEESPQTLIQTASGRANFSHWQRLECSRGNTSVHRCTVYRFYSFRFGTLFLKN